MVCFAKDVDVLRYEPMLFGELHPAWQVLSSGSGGVLTGTSFMSSSADFTGSQVQAGGVVYLRSADGVLDGTYEIVSVDSSTALTVSVLRADAEGSAVAPPAATDVTYRVSTFRPQIEEAGFGLTEYFGLQGGSGASEFTAADVLDTDVLKPATVFAVISSVYAMLASKAEDENFWKKSLYYQRLFEKARQRCRVGLDVNGDGVADVTRLGGSVQLVRD